MKRKGLFLVTLILAICMVSQTMVLAAWEPYYGEQQASGYAVKVEKSWNDAGQTVYKAYNSYGGVILDIRARGGNIWNETTQVLCTSTNKGADYVGISKELDVFGINYARNPMKYRNGFQNGEVPYVLSDVYTTNFVTSSTGVVTGFYTDYGVYNLDDGYTTNNSTNCNSNNYNSYSEYPKVVQNGNEYYYYYNPYASYTYRYNQSTLSYNGSKLSNISEIAFAPGYLFAVTTSNKVYQIKIGALQKEETYNEYFREWLYSNNDTWVIGYISNYGNSIYFDNDYSYNNNYNYNYNNNYTNNKYPNFYQDGTRLVYNSNANSTYVYSLTSKKLTWNGIILSDNAEQVEFSKGYIVFVNASHECRRAPLGSTISEHVCYNFVEFNYDYDGFVTEAISSRTGNHDV